MVATLAPESAIERLTTGPILEVAAPPMFFCSDFTSSSHGSLQGVKVSPAEDDRVLVEAIGATACVSLTVRGSCDASLSLPGKLLGALRTRHPDAELLSARRDEDQRLSVRSYSQEATTAMQCSEPSACFDSFPNMAADQVEEAKMLRIDPVLLSVVARRIGKLRGVGVSVLSCGWGLRFELRGDDLTGRVMVLGLRA